MAYFPTVRMETTTYRAGGREYRQTTLRDVTLPGLGHNESACLHALYCGPVEGTTGKVFRVALWTITGAVVGVTFNGVQGAGVGGSVGTMIGIATICNPKGI